jgi:cupin fold WbuC family metalloprotein
MSSVLTATDDIVVVNAETLQSLKKMAAAAPLKRSRLCLHRTSNDPIQEMVIAFARDSYVRVHRHRNKSESFHVLVGSLQVVFFDDEGHEIRRIRLGAPETGLPSLYRLSCDAWHAVLIESEFAIIHETTNGPFVPSEAEFAYWAPDGSDLNVANDFLTHLRAGTSASDSVGIIPRSPSHSATEPVTSDVDSSKSEKKSPTLTTIICNYNHGRYLSRAIEAMVNQSRPAEEFIIVDDGSTDDSVSVIRSWTNRYPTIRFIQNERNLGFHASFQRAISAATSDFIYSGAADDRVLPGFFEGAMRLAEKNPTTGIISGQYISVDPSGQRLSTSKLSAVHEAEFLEPKRFLRDVLNVEPPTHSLSGSTIFRRKPLLDVGGCRIELGSWGDTFAIQALGLQYGFCYWPHPAMEWTILPGSLSQTTRSDPTKAMRIVDRATQLMRSDAFRDLFPADYVDRWAKGFQQSIAHEQLHLAIEGNQAFQQCRRSVAETASLPIRLLLNSLGFATRALYFVTFRVMRYVVSGQIRNSYQADSQ